LQIGFDGIAGHILAGESFTPSENSVIETARDHQRVGAASLVGGVFDFAFERNTNVPTDDFHNSHQDTSNEPGARKLSLLGRRGASFVRYQLARGA
jgi:hypothetical protein